ncbi:hypothetical protein QJS10_CPB17g02476 [Acorus calamus]|uniref:Uncharacterized protein n=1 Tax=Acorus calamus TaxID=4465 RepID=A0AAV9CUE9_ACOCL|nr:hypothetical protein QJS10_CPB17g02476 [Acorus calamus]
MADQGVNARVIVKKKVGLEVPGDERDGSFKREEGVAEALRVAMVEEGGGGGGTESKCEAHEGRVCGQGSP